LAKGRIAAFNKQPAATEAALRQAAPCSAAELSRVNHACTVLPLARTC
jgi:hypothetical protein